MIFILFTHHNFKLYLEWGRDATQGYFAECRMKNCIVLNMQMKRENNLALFFLPFENNAILRSAFCKIPLPKMPSFVHLHFGGFLFSVLTLEGSHHPPPHLYPHLLRPNQTHCNKNSKIYFKDISKVQMEKN